MDLLKQLSLADILNSVYSEQETIDLIRDRAVLLDDKEAEKCQQWLDINTGKR